MWRDSDDDEDDYGDGPLPRNNERVLLSQDRRAPAGGRQGEDHDDDGTISDELTYACSFHLSLRNAQDRVTAETLQSNLYCTDAQAEALLVKMVEIGTLLPCGSAFVKGVALYRVAVPAKASSSDVTADVEMPYYPEPDDFSVKPTRQRLYGAASADAFAKACPKSVTPEISPQKGKLPNKSRRSAITSPPAAGQALEPAGKDDASAPLRKDGVTRLEEMFGRVNVRESTPSSAARLSTSASKNAKVSQEAKPLRSMAYRARPRYGGRSSQTHSQSQSQSQAVLCAVQSAVKTIHKPARARGVRT